MPRIFLLLYCFVCILFAREYTPEEKLSQMFIIGFKGTNSSSFYNSVAGISWGGYVLYSQDKEGDIINIKSKKQIQKLIKSIRGSENDTKIKPFIAIDMEGGKLQISKGKKSTFNYFESPADISNKDNTKQIEWAHNISTSLQELGFNLNLAPVVDVDRLPCVNSRSFGSDFEQVIKISRIFLKEHELSGISCTLKHFPGLCSGKQNDIEKTYSEKIDLQPFRVLVNNKNVSCVMLSRAIFSYFDIDIQAYKSAKVIKLLRSLGFKRIVMTDDLSDTMPEFISEKQLQEEIISAIEAGNDILLFANTGNNYDPLLADKLRKAIKNILEKRLVSEHRIEQSFQRILRVKQDMGIEPKEIYLNYDL